MSRTNTYHPSGMSLGTLYILASTLLLLSLNTAFAQPWVYERSFGTQGSGPGQFEQITAIDMDSQGNYVILDGYVGEYQICSNTGVCDEFETAAKKANEHGNQWGLAVNCQDEIFITSQWGKVE